MAEDLAKLALSARTWPFEEARKVLARTEKGVPEKGYVLFETGYGPSGLPHIGTFGEVARTSMVRHAFATMSDIPTKLIAFSDDMDGLRKVPDNIPNKEMVGQYLGKPLTSVPDPFGTHESFGHHNNARLRSFLDAFGFQYEFLSSTECYKAGRFDATLMKVLANYDAVANVVLPTLGKERRETYSPFLPVSPKTGRVLQVPLIARDVAAGTVSFVDEDGSKAEVPVTGGHCKLQWRVDWAMRWAAFGVDYEMSGKDLIDSVKLGSQICRILGGVPPAGFTYELFLDENGEKISKSRGNGLAVEDWLRYAPPESLGLFMYHQPTRAKKLYFDVIPRNVDDYLAHLESFAEAKLAGNLVAQLNNPAWHIHAGNPPQPESHISFGLLLNLVGVCNTDDAGMLWKFISRYAPAATPQTAPILDRLVSHAIAYFEDFVRPAKTYRAPSEAERAALDELARVIETLPSDADAEAIQFEVYEVGKRHGFTNLREWFGALYETLLGQTQGPRMGSFIALYGRAETVALIRRVLAGENLAVA